MTPVPLDRVEAPGFMSSRSQSHGLATVHHAGGMTPLKLPGGPAGLDQMNVGHKELETVYSQTAFRGKNKEWTYFWRQAVGRKDDTYKHVKQAVAYVPKKKQKSKSKSSNMEKEPFRFKDHTSNIKHKNRQKLYDACCVTPSAPCWAACSALQPCLPFPPSCLADPVTEPWILHGFPESTGPCGTTRQSVRVPLQVTVPHCLRSIFTLCEANVCVCVCECVWRGGCVGWDDKKMMKEHMI